MGERRDAESFSLASLQAESSEAASQAAMVATQLGKTWGLSAADTGESARTLPLLGRAPFAKSQPRRLQEVRLRGC